MNTQATPTDKLWHIKNCPLFSALSTEELEAIKAASEMYEMGRNRMLPAPPQDEPSLFVVKKGHVQLTYTDEQGNEAVVILLGPGDVFGSLDSTDLTFGEHCRTVSDACICRISRPRFEAMLHKYPTLAFSLTKFSLLRISRLQVRLAEMMMRQADERLALALLDLDRQVGRDEPGGRRKLTISLTHADLAKLIGTSREMVTILMGKFRQQSLVESEKGWIYLKDLGGLKKMATRS
jgi:CRP-like cAMP-binding protein